MKTRSLRPFPLAVILLSLLSILLPTRSLHAELPTDLMTSAPDSTSFGLESPAFPSRDAEKMASRPFDFSLSGTGNGIATFTSPKNIPTNSGQYK